MHNENNSKQSEITLVDLWYTITNHIKTILLITTIFFILAVVYAWFIVTPKYSSEGDVMVQVEQSSSTTNDPNFDLVNALRLIDTVAELMEKEVVLVNAIRRLEDLGYQDITVKYLRDGLNVKSSETSYFINISFNDENKEFAKNAVDSVIDAVIEETDIADAFPVLTNKIRRTSFASDALYYSPNKVFYVVFGISLGIFISLGYIFANEAFSSQYKSRDEIEKNLNIQVLGVIPKMNFKEKSREKK